jgi:glutamyl-Q tRNA(Asp) synthetase
MLAYLHVAVVNNDVGEKLSKQTGAVPLDRHAPLQALVAAARHLGIDVSTDSLDTFYSVATAEWAKRFAR